VSFKVSIEPRAVYEIEAAFAWYESKNVGLGGTFLKTLAAATERLERSATQFKLERENIAEFISPNSPMPCTTPSKARKFSSWLVCMHVKTLRFGLELKSC
jgi:hypothetical protein